MPVFRIQHITQYEYNRPVKESISHIRIFPIADDRQQIFQEDLFITDNPTVDLFLDYYGNRVGDFSVLTPHTRLTIDSRIVVKIPDEMPPPPLPVMPDALQTYLDKDIRLFWLAQPEQISDNHMLHTMLSEMQLQDKPVDEIARVCCNYIYKEFTYKKGITDVETTVEQILEHRSGVCQDFAHVLLQLLRIKGIPARYVSGYICPNKSGMRGEGATHAWVEYFAGPNGWLGIDPTNNVAAGPNHVRLAVGRDFGDCSPVKGTFKGIARQKLSVYVSVGYEDGHTFESVNDVEMHSVEVEGIEPWQDALLAAQQQQQQQQ